MLTFAIIGWLFGLSMTGLLLAWEHDLKRALAGWQRANERSRAFQQECERQHEAWMRCVDLLSQMPDPPKRKFAEPSRN